MQAPNQMIRSGETDECCLQINFCPGKNPSPQPGLSLSSSAMLCIVILELSVQGINAWTSPQYDGQTGDRGAEVCAAEQLVNDS